MSNDKAIITFSELVEDDLVIKGWRYKVTRLSRQSHDCWSVTSRPRHDPKDEIERCVTNSLHKQRWALGLISNAGLNAS